jgi:ribosomal protein S27AE
MSSELLSPKLDELELQDIDEDAVLPNMRQEIECPRCSDIMILSSDFDKLLYFCKECELSLLLK